MKSIFKNPVAKSVFQVTSKTGFLSESPPQIALPSRYDPVKRLIEATSIQQKDGSSGLLANGSLGSTIDT